MAVIIAKLIAEGYEEKDLDVEIPNEELPRLLEFARDTYPNIQDPDTEQWAPATEEESVDMLFTAYVELMLADCERHFDLKGAKERQAHPLRSRSAHKERLAERARKRVAEGRERIRAQAEAVDEEVRAQAERRKEAEIRAEQRARKKAGKAG